MSLRLDPRLLPAVLGVQVPRVVIQGVTDHLTYNNAQLGAGHSVSNRADASMAGAHETIKARAHRQQLWLLCAKQVFNAFCLLFCSQAHCCPECCRYTVSNIMQPLAWMQLTRVCWAYISCHTCFRSAQLADPIEFGIHIWLTGLNLHICIWACRSL